MLNLVSELRRRGVLRVAAAYALASWIFIEAGSVLLPTFGASDEVFRIYVIVVIVGFIAALLIAWFYQLTDSGLKRETPAQELPSNRETRERWPLFYPLVIGMLIVALAVSIALNMLGLRDDTGAAANQDLSIAVLPFTDLSANLENSGFVDGIHDDLLTKLANIDAMKVISRTSVMSYRGTTKNISQIGRELGVNTILEGSVQRLGDNVRINMQLIDALSDEHLWAKTYDREITAKNIFAIQSEITTQISQALKATLSPEQLSRVKVVPTENISAYRLVVAARQNVRLRIQKNLEQARDQFEQAIELDPEYADAYVGLADSTLLLNINHQAISDEIAFSNTQKAIDRALEIDRNHADAYATQGLLLTQKANMKMDDKNIQLAETSFKRALELNPSNARAWMWYSSLLASKGDVETAIKYNQKSLELDPLSRISYLSIAKLHAGLGKNNESIADYLNGINIHPNWPTIYHAFTDQLVRLGRLDEALAWKIRAQAIGDKPHDALNYAGILFQLNMPDKAIQFFESLDSSDPDYVYLQAYFLALDSKPEQALALVSDAYSSKAGQPGQVNLMVTSFALQSGNLGLVEERVLEAFPGLEDAEARLTAYNGLSALYIAHAWMQSDNRTKKQKGLKLANKILDSLDQLPRLGSAGFGILDVRLLAMLGRKDDAIVKFTDAVSQGFISPLPSSGFSLETDPLLDSIRQSPEFLRQVELIDQRVKTMRSNVEQSFESNDWKPLIMKTQGS